MKLTERFKAFFCKEAATHDDSLENEFYIRLNDRVMPLARGEIYESPIEEILSIHGDGEIVNSGTMQSKDGEIEFCDIDIAFSRRDFDREAIIALLVDKLNNLGAPIGSYLLDKLTRKRFDLGRLQGIGIYLNGTELPQEVYEECDINVVIEKFQQAIGIQNQELRYWRGPTETVLYFYGTSFKEMEERVSEFIAQYPLCQKCRVERVA